MIKKNKILAMVILGVFLSSYSCSSIQQLRLEKDKSLAVSIGQIVTKEGVLKNNIETKGATNQATRMQLSVIKKKLEGVSLKRFKNWQGSASSGNKEENSTSQMYLEIELIDDIAYAQAINQDIDLKNYVQQSKKAAVVTTLKCVSNPLLEGEGSVFLETTESGSFTMGIYDGDDKKLNTIAFRDLDIFDYQVSYFCYGLDQRNQIAVMDLVEEGKHCKRPLERKVKNLTTTKKLVDY